MNDGDAMKARAETANVPRLVQGSDGAQWAADVLRDPMRTLPGGAGFLIVKHLTPAPARPVNVILEALELEGVSVIVNDGYVILDELISVARMPRVVALLGELARAIAEPST